MKCNFDKIVKFFIWLKCKLKPINENKLESNVQSDDYSVQGHSEAVPIIGTAEETASFWTKLQELEIKVNKTHKEAENTLNEMKDTKALVIFGFFALILVVIALIYGYWQYVSDSFIKDDYKYQWIEKQNDQEKEMIKKDERISDLEKENKEILDILKCLKGKRNWQYEQCFK